MSRVRQEVGMKTEVKDPAAVVSAPGKRAGETPSWAAIPRGLDPSPPTRTWDFLHRQAARADDLFGPGP